MHPAALPPTLLERDCDVRTGRIRGPGGQHRNRTESAIFLRHLPSRVEAQATERRSQHDNRRVAFFRLRINLALAVRTVPSDDSTPSPLWQSRCHSGRILVNSEHDDFPTLLAEVLDQAVLSQGALKGTAAHFGCTTSQLIKFLQKEPRAWQLISSLKASASDAGDLPL